MSKIAAILCPLYQVYPFPGPSCVFMIVHLQPHLNHLFLLCNLGTYYFLMPCMNLFIPKD